MKSWLLRQSWSQLVMAHWALSPDVVRRAVPEAFELDLRDGRAWVSVVPFMTERVRVRALPPIPGLLEFPELNVRTYVWRGGHAGVYFLRILATNPVVVRAARLLAGVEYRDATMSVRAGDDFIDYESEQRRAGPAAGPRWSAHVARSSGLRTPSPGSLDGFLTDRYAAFSMRAGVSLCVPIAHAPWQIADLAVDVLADTLTADIGVPVAGPPDVAHWTAGQDDVRIAAPRRTGRTTTVGSRPAG